MSSLPMSPTTVSSVLFSNAALLDPLHDELLEDHHVLVEDGVVKEVSDRPLRSRSARTRVSNWGVEAGWPVQPTHRQSPSSSGTTGRTEKKGQRSDTSR